MSVLQQSRKHFIPGTPKCYVDVTKTKIRLVKTTLPIRDELKPIFPTLLAGGAEGMPNIEIVVDDENGTLLKSEKPLKVCLTFRRYTKFLDRVCFVGRSGSWWTQCDHGSL
jgi:hypothetical protein